MIRFAIAFALVIVAVVPAVAASYCLPKNGKDRIAKTGTCPSGYFASGDCCEAFATDTKKAFPKQIGKACPSGSYVSGSACVSFH
jgi:hypothetical protein